MRGGQVAAAAGQAAGVKRVLYAEYDAPAGGFLPEAVAPIVQAAQKQFGFSHVFAAATAVGKGVMPRVAGALDVELVSDVIGIVDEHTFVRAIYAGAAGVAGRGETRRDELAEGVSLP